MKNKPNHDILLPQNVKKFFLTMKIFFLLLMLTMLNAYSTSIFSQNATVSVDMRNATVREVVGEIERQGGISFLFNDNLPGLDKRVSITFADQPIKDVLESALAQADMTYEEIKDDFVVLLSKTEYFQQYIIVTGRVIDEATGEPLPGVSIVIQGTAIGTVTNTEGYYKIDVPDKDAVLLFSFVGYSSRQMAVGDQTTINVELQLDFIGLEEVVAVGYGVVRKSDLTGSVQRVNAERYENQATTNVLEMLSGTVAGFSSNQGTRAAGGGSMLIRGQTSLKANNNPLIVLDGVIYNGSIGDINPADIESVDILKDASSAAIFGARSASGIIIMTTKRGSTGDPTINFSAKVGVVGLTNIMRPFGPEEYISARIDNQKQTYNRPPHYFSNPNNLPSDISLEEWKNYDATPSDDPVDMWLNRLTLTGTEKKNFLADKPVNWYDEIMRNGIRQDYDLSISGGISNLRYYWSIGHTNNEGYQLGDEFKTIRSRINVDADVAKFLKFKLSTQFADRDQGYEITNLGQAITASPYGQIYSDDGKMEWYPHEEIVAGNPLIYYTYRDRHNKTQSLFTHLSAELLLTLGITYNAAFIPRFSWNKNFLFDPIETPRGGQQGGFASKTQSNLYEWQIDHLIKWNRTIAEIHNIDLTFLYSAEKYQSWFDSQSNSRFAPSDALSFHAIGAGLNPSVSSNNEYSTGNAIMGRINYSLMNKYLLTLTWRRDGYSAFGQENPYSTFPSAALAWRISEEDFFDVNWISNAAIRASWGTNGNRDIGRYDALARLSTTNYIYGNSMAVGVFSSTMANSSLRWEKTEALNVGLDIGFLNNRLYTSIDFYSTITEDLLLDRRLPDIIGYSSVAANLGEVRNKGIEMTISSSNVTVYDNIKWNSSLVFSFNRNKITHLYGDMVDIADEYGNVIGQREADDWVNEWFIGESIDRIWDYERLGVWQLDEAEEAEVYGRRPGDIKLRDVNGDGVLQPADDKVFQGYKTPRYRLGFRNDISFLQNFELSFFIRADLGFYRENNIDEGSSWIDRRNILYAPYWTPENPSNEYAMLNTEKNAPYKVWKNSSFFRLQDVSLSYNIPDRFISNYNMQNLRIFVNLRNYYTITNWDHWDPETGRSPMPKYLTFGVNLGF